MLRALPILLLFVAGCASTPAIQPPIAAHDPSILYEQTTPAGGRAWQAEAEKALGVKPYVLICHGGTEIDGRGKRIWCMYPAAPLRPIPVEIRAWMLRQQLPPEVPILLLCCNPDGLDIHVPNVWYAHSDVWCYPMPWPIDSDECAGSFDRFVKSKP